MPAPIALSALYWFDPTQAGNLVLSGDAVVSYTDRIAGLEVVQGFASRRPTYDPASLFMGGRPGLVFDAANLTNLGTAPGAIPADLSDEYTVYADANPVGPAGVLSGLHDAGGQAWALLLYASGAYLSERNDVSASAIAAYAGAMAGTHQWFGGWNDGVNIAARQLAGEASVPRVARPLTTDRLWIGAYNTGSPFSGVVGHVVWFDRRLTAPEEAILEDWFAQQVSPAPFARESMPAVQASFRRGTANQYVTVAPGEIITSVTDSIPMADKAVPEAPYVLPEYVASGGPTLGAENAMSYDGTQGFAALSPLAAHLDAAITIYSVVRSAGAGALTHSLHSASDENPTYILSQDWTSPRIVRASSGFPTTAAAGPAKALNAKLVQAHRFDAGTLTLTVFGAGIPGTPAVTTAVIPAGSLTRVGIGCLARAAVGSFHVGEIFETLHCLAAHTDHEVAFYSARLLAEYPDDASFSAAFSAAFSRP